jgi:hypothetical protein
LEELPTTQWAAMAPGPRNAPVSGGRFAFDPDAD